jgi:formiminoglutamase
MDLKLFLDQVDPALHRKDLSANSFQNSIFINSTIMHDLDGIDIALLGLGDYRGTGINSMDFDPASEVRNLLYGLSKTSGTNRILDLGNLRNGPTPEETAIRLQEVCAHLMQNDVLPIIIGGSQDLSFGQYTAYSTLGKLLTLINIDAEFDLGSDDQLSKTYLTKIFKYDPNFLFNYVHLGYQAYFIDEDELAMLEKLYFEAHRLGACKENIKEMEPIIRDADLLIWDLSSIQEMYVPSTLQPNPFGFTGEEACQLAWYAGLNDKLTSFGLYNLSSVNDQSDRRSAMVVATMIWYFIEGYYHRKGDKNFMTSDYLIYEVSMGKDPDSIRFFKSKLSEKWWMEIPDENVNSVFIRNKMVPCSYQDYETALSGEVPQRWLSAMAKMS